MTKSIEFTKVFQKHLRTRYAHQPKVIDQLRLRLKMFQDGIRDEPLNDHPLSGKMKGLRSFSIAGDIRLIYEETNEAYILKDIGSHSQVYR